MYLITHLKAFLNFLENRPEACRLPFISNHAYILTVLFSAKIYRYEV
jgi:hypothetical protein